MNIRKLKGAFVLTMGGLTGIAVTACRWQWRRHDESKLRWDTINSEIKNFKPNPLTDTLDPYRLTAVTGKILKDKLALVMRVKDGRMGYMVVVPVEFSGVTSTDKKGVLVNLGWVPEDMVSQLDMRKILRTETDIGSSVAHQRNLWPCEEG